MELISDGYFDGHEVLFSDVKTELASSHASANLLIVGHNCFAEESGEQPIDTHAIEALEERGVGKVLNHWYMSANSKNLASQGRVFEARDVVLAWFEVNPAARG